MFIACISIVSGMKILYNKISTTITSIEINMMFVIFPCGEGAGYAGGIVSAGVDGERCAEMCAEYLKQQ